MEKARRVGINSIGAYKMEVQQHIRFLTSEKAYEAYIEYWNSKLNEMGKMSLSFNKEKPPKQGLR